MERPGADGDPDGDDAGPGDGFADGATVESVESAASAAGNDGDEGEDGNGGERESDNGDERGRAEEEWKFGLDEVGPDGVVEAEPEPLEPGQPTLENVVFVLLGVVGTLLLLSTVV